MTLNKFFNDTEKLISEEYLKNNIPWSIGYSGGKDSSALLKLTFEAIRKVKNASKPINIIYCDTGVEIPIMNSLIDETFSRIKTVSQKCNLPFNCFKISPRVTDRYFVKVIGRGYPPPTNIFRWCTDKLRVNPIQSFIKKYSEENIVLLGIRKGESKERDKIILKHYLEDIYYFKQTNHKQAKIFSPILHFEEKDVWELILNEVEQVIIDGPQLRKFYTLVESNTTNELGGRFGCWTCTVVRKDKAVNNLINAGYKNLIPLYEFRNWLVSIRDLPEYRCKTRRNGQKGPGPFTLQAREVILEQLLIAQNKSKFQLIEQQELDFITHLWSKDINSKKYKE